LYQAGGNVELQVALIAMAQRGAGTPWYISHFDVLKTCRMFKAIEFVNQVAQHNHRICSSSPKTLFPFEKWVALVKTDGEEERGTGAVFIDGRIEDVSPEEIGNPKWQKYKSLKPSKHWAFSSIV
jgi:hypothetical protein